jgi:hypothetical protein
MESFFGNGIRDLAPSPDGTKSLFIVQGQSAALCRPQKNIFLPSPRLGRNGKPKVAHDKTLERLRTVGLENSSTPPAVLSSAPKSLLLAI